MVNSEPNGSRRKVGALTGRLYSQPELSSIRLELPKMSKERQRHRWFPTEPTGEEALETGSRARKEAGPETDRK